MASDDPRGFTHRLLWAGLLVFPSLAIGLVVLVALEVRDRLPELLAWAAAEWVPGVELRVASVRLDSAERLVAEGVVITLPEAHQPFFRVDRLEVDFALSEIFDGRVRAVRLVRPTGLWTPESSGRVALSSGEARGENATGTSWRVDRVTVSEGHLEVSVPPRLPETVFDFELDLADVGSAEASAKLARSLVATGFRLGPDTHPLLSATEIELRLSLEGLRAKRLESLRIVKPEIDLTSPVQLAGEDSGDSDGADETTGFVVGRLVIEDGHVRSPSEPDVPGVDARFALDLENVGDTQELADRVQVVDVSDVRVTIPGSNVAPMLSLAAASIEVSVAGLIHERYLDVVRVPDGSLLLDGRGRDFLMTPATKGESAAGAAWRIGTLELGTLAVHLAELGSPLPDVTFDLHTTLNDLPLSAAAAAIADQTQRLELASVALYSPFDPFKKVVSVENVFVEFSLGGLTQQKIRLVKFVRPTIYLAEDLFWYMTNERADETSSAPSPWSIDLLQAEIGRLILEIGKTRRVDLPITFETEVRDVRLDNLADLKIAAELLVPEKSYSFSDYDVNLERVRGRLQFDYPPGRGSENFVSTLYADALEWRDYSIEEGWLSLTFDPTGISGTFGGSGYQGYVNGGITVPYAWAEPWVGWVSASALDLEQVTAVLAGGTVEMTGPLDANIALTIANQALDKADGAVTIAKPGRLEITKIDESRIPTDWPSWQRDLARIGVQALRNFEYDEGRGTLSFERGVGLATLDLTGPAGDRNVEVHYHAEGSDPLALDVSVASREDAE